MSAPADWITVERPGYLGSARDATHAQWDATYGPGQWRLAWLVNGHAFDREQMTMLYEDAYYEFLRYQVNVREQLIREARDVYDDSPTNVQSGLDYRVQETGRTHVQDIAIRRAVSRLGLVFEGDQLIQIRDNLGEHPLSMTLSPGQVPFHRPHLILTPGLDGWWKPGSVEAFYQSNKVLQITHPAQQASGTSAWEPEVRA